MSPWRRTFILIFISLNKGPTLGQSFAPGIPQNPAPALKEYVTPSGSSNSQLLNSLLSIASANGVLPNVLPALQRIFPESQNLVINEGIPQPFSLEVPNGGSCQQCFQPNLVAGDVKSLPPFTPSNSGITNSYPAPPRSVVNEGILPQGVTNGPSCQQCFTPNLFVTNPTSPYPISQSNSIQQSYPISPPKDFPPTPVPSLLPPPPTFAAPSSITQQVPTTPPIPITDRIYNSIGSVPMGPLRPQPVKQGDIYPPNCLQSEITQQQFNLPMPQMLPSAYPITRPPVLSSLPSISPSQNIGSWPYLSEPISTSEPIEGPVANVGFIDTITDYGHQLPMPMTLQINMPAPVMPEPVISVISTSPAVGQYSSPFDIPSYPMPYPTHTVEKSRSKWKSWLPIILLALLDGGFGDYCGGCSGCQCPSNIPIPYPIPIPTNNPILVG